MYRRAEQSVNSLWEESNFTHIHVDMHCHSSFSDGTITPEQVAKNLNDAGVKYASLVDHNTLLGLPVFKRALAKFGIGFV